MWSRASGASREGFGEEREAREAREAPPHRWARFARRILFYASPGACSQAKNPIVVVLNSGPICSKCG